MIDAAGTATLAPSFPWATLFVNVTGSFVIGFFATITAPGGRWSVKAMQLQFVMTGFCDDYTSFSSFSIETLQLLQGGHIAMATLNISAAPAGWLLAVWLGEVLTGRLNSAGRT